MTRLLLAGVAALAVGPLAAQTGQPTAQEAMQDGFGLPAAAAAPAPAAPPAAAAAQVSPSQSADATALTPAQLAGAQARVGGRYRSQGANLDGSPYEGEAEIVMSGRERCRITWRTGRSSTQRGICMRTGYIFVASYQFQQGAIGIVTYQVQPDGVLKGHWTIADTEGRGAEILTPLR
ncbi:MAG: hypothetical protein JNK46_18020 [Methylobacteriaceae bacterium]|nr:hypothetical protein [Methylobacteriaceae bacterium]